MSFDISKYVKLAPWLQFVGLMLVIGGLVFIQEFPLVSKVVAYVGTGVSFAGFIYDRIYQ